MGKSHTFEEDWPIVEALLDEKSQREASTMTGIPRSTIQNWIEKAAEIGMTEQDEIDKGNYDVTAMKNDLRRLMRKKSLYDHIGKQFVDSAVALPPIKTIPKRRKSVAHDVEELCLMLSDMQIGEVVNPTETGGLGEYSTEHFHQRLEFLKQSLAKIFDIHRNEVPYNRINLYFLGDIIEGSTIFRGQLRSIDRTTVEQVMAAVDAMTYLIQWLATEFPEVGVYCVVGNHGRIGNFGENSPMDNLDYLVYKWMEERLSNTKNIEFNVAETWWMVVERQSHRFCLVHGDDVKGWMGIPFYGADRSEAKVQKLLGVDFDYYLLGHHHTPAQWGGVIMNGCWVGGSEFSLKRMQVGGPPSQKLFSLHNIFGLTWSRDVQLVNPEEKTPTKVYG
jgi:hypothetical protein